MSSDRLAEVDALEARSPELASILRRCLTRVLTTEEVERRAREADGVTSLGRLLEAGVPTPIRARMAAGLDERRGAMLAIMAAMSGDAPATLVCLVGPSGCGKTTAACWWLSYQAGGRFVGSSHLSALSEKLLSDRAELHQLQRAPAVVVDDLGRGSETDADRARIGDYLCERADLGLRTICTALAANRLAYGESIARRMAIRRCS